MPCRICKSAERLEITGALEDGLTMNEVARRFGLPRILVQRHAKKCLELSYKPSEEARRLTDFGLKRQAGRLEAALKAANKMEEMAIAKGDTVAQYRAQKNAASILALMEKQTRKTLPSVARQSRASVRGLGAQGAREADFVVFPEGTDETIARVFGGRVHKNQFQVAYEKSLPADAPVVTWRIEWVDSEIPNPELFYRPRLKELGNEQRGYLEAASAEEIEIVDAMLLAIEEAKAAALLVDPKKLAN